MANERLLFMKSSNNNHKYFLSVKKYAEIFISALLIAAMAVVFTSCGKDSDSSAELPEPTDAWLAASENTVPIFASSESISESGNKTKTMYQAGCLARGTKVTDTHMTVTVVDGVITDTVEDGKSAVYYEAIQIPEAQSAAGLLSYDSASAASASAVSLSGDSDSADSGYADSASASADLVPDGSVGNDDGDSFSDVVTYFVPVENITADYASCVQETSRWVRTSVTVYERNTGAEIAGFVKKGNELSVCGYDYINSDGSVNKYNVQIPDTNTSGWVYAKYLVNDQASAEAVYESVYNIHKNRIYTDLELNGGLPSNLDWYPYERTVIEGNQFCTEAKTMYLCAEACVNSESYLELIRNHGINAVVIDIKDGQLAYKADTARQNSPHSYAAAFVTADEYAEAVKAFKDAGVYVIGRIVCFSDSYYAEDHPDSCIVSASSDSSWPSAYSRDAWYYNVQLALESIEKMDFDEIQFDYVRFPENAYGMSLDTSTDFRNTYDEDKAEAIQNFCFYAADCIHEAGAYFSVDVFGECADEYVTAYGQYWPAISNIVDAISGMPYTDHYGSAEDTWTNPYDVVYKFATLAAARQKEVDTPAVARTWITGYDTPNWEPTVDYDEEKLTQQINALYTAGLTGGFIPWNGGSNILKYQEYAGIWDKTYPTQ